MSGWHTGQDSSGYAMPDFWVVKLSSSGALQWQKCLGGSGLDSAKSIIQTIDRGYISAGITYSNDGDVSGNHRSSDYWVVKLKSIADHLGIYKSTGVWNLDYNGNGTWDGSSIDRAYSFGSSRDQPVVGDWNGGGKDEIGNYKGNGVLALDYNGNGQWDGTSTDRIYSFGSSTDQPIVGDWNADGKTEI